MRSGGNSAQFRPIVQLIEMAQIGQGSLMRRLVVMVSDGELFASAVIAVIAQEIVLQGLQNHGYS